MTISYKKVQIKRFNGSSWDYLNPVTSYNNLTDVPSTFTPSYHTHSQYLEKTASDCPVVIQSNTTYTYLGFNNSLGTRLGSILVSANKKLAYNDGSTEKEVQLKNTSLDYQTVIDCRGDSNVNDNPLILKSNNGYNCEIQCYNSSNNLIGCIGASLSGGSHPYFYSSSNGTKNIQLQNDNIDLGDGTNYFRYRTEATLEAGFYYHTYGDESLVFANKYADAGWMFVNGTKPSDMPYWTTFNGSDASLPVVHIKKGCLAINKLIGQGATTPYALDVNGRCMFYTSGTDTPLNLKGNSTKTYVEFQNSSGSTLGYYGVNASHHPIFYVNGDQNILLEGEPTTMDYVTSAPTSSNNNGIKLAILSSEPSTKYSGWLYIITN